MNAAGAPSHPRQYFANLRPEMLPFIPTRRGKILEVGCGEGKFAASIAGAEEVWGVEPDIVAAKVAATRLRRVLVGSYDSVADELPDSYFDVVVCNDVIEHMIDHDAFFSEVRRKIAPGGAIVGSVPNVRYFRNLFDLLVLRDWDYKDVGVLDRTHLRYFTERSLRRSLVGAGYRVELLSGINGGIRPRLSLRDAVYSLFGALLIGGTFGHSRDVAFMQLAFRAAPPSNSARQARNMVS